MCLCVEGVGIQGIRYFRLSVMRDIWHKESNNVAGKIRVHY